MVQLTGDDMTKVFEEPYDQARTWCDDMARWAASRGCTLETQYFFYTTCPKCAEGYGKNYVVGVAKVH